MSDKASQLERFEYFGLVAIPKNPPDDLVDACDARMEQERAIVVELEPLRFVPNDFGDIAGHQGLKADDDIFVRRHAVPPVTTGPRHQGQGRRQAKRCGGAG